MGRVKVLALVLVCGIAVLVGGGERDGDAAMKRWGKAIGQFEEWDSNSDVADAGELRRFGGD